MAVLRVLKYGNPVLRMKSEDIDGIDDSIKKLAQDMIDTMQSEEGIGLAAPQVAELISLFVIDMSLIEEDGKPMAVINPAIIDTKGEAVIEEGCLCIPEIREEVKRPETIRVKYRDIDGNEHEQEFGGLKARVFQHEIDHLHGVLFVDRIGAMKKKMLHKKLKKIADDEKTLINA